MLNSRSIKRDSKPLMRNSTYQLCFASAKHMFKVMKEKYIGSAAPVE